MTVGGMIASAKRIRTKKGDPMMFATLDDLEGSVELVIFGKALDASGDALATDSIVLVRGRVDHKDRERTCLVVQQVDRFRADARGGPQAAERGRPKAAAAPERAAPAPRRRVAARFGARASSRSCLAGFPGEAEVVVELITSAGRAPATARP